MTANGLRIFLLAPGSREGAQPRISPFMQSQADSLRAHGCEVTVGVIDERKSLPGLVRNLRRLKRELRASEATVVHALYGSVTALTGAMLKGRRRLVVSFCGDDLLGTPVPGWRWRVRESMARALGIVAALSANRVIVKSPNLMRALPRLLRRRAVVLPNGVDTRRFHCRDRSECRNLLGWPEEGSIVLFNASHGADVVVKHPELAHAAVARLAGRRAHTELRVISKYTADEVALALGAADCLLVTSLHEGSPNIVKEAMAAGLPVVSVRCGDVEERLANVTPGAVCGRDADQIGEAIGEVLASGRRSNGPEEIVRQGLTVEAVAGRLTDIYQDGVGSREPARREAQRVSAI